ncbi:uncharacterized protein LOC125062914 [Pieris napi]|uniref:uncharacterized protein LOC125062914 n=1 Tax=Pieris napi TaxID=78633 RepID=UPI001FBA8E3E|nr:uncharacterized protein LOC125062914 [Pieris napi]
MLFKVTAIIVALLEGKAESACSIRDFNKWPQLEDFLKAQFGDKKHYAYLLADLQDCKQSTNETISQYSLKVESCLSKLLAEINISIPTKKKDELVGRVAAMQDLALNIFTTGLQPQLSTIVRCKDPSTLSEAIAFAIAEEKILGMTNKKHNNIPRPNSTPNRFSRPNFSSNNTANVITCRYCKNMGHSIENCRKRQYNNSRNPNRNPNSNQNRNQNFTQNRAQHIDTHFNYQDNSDEYISQGNLN